MERIHSLLQALYNSPHYSFGWIIFAFLALLPAIVSGNMVQHHMTQLFKNKQAHKDNLKAFAINLIVLITCIFIMTYAFYLYIWQ